MRMTFKESLKTKVSDDTQASPEFAVLLKLIDAEEIKNADDLKHFLDAQETKASAAVASEKSPTGNDRRRRLAKDIKFYKSIREKILPHL